MANFKFDTRKLEKSIKQQSVSALNKKTYNVTCPHCKKQVTVPTGKSICPFCKKEVDLTLDITF